jgi:hypothetical protein
VTPKKIRQRIVLCTIALVIALPAETILVQAVTEPSAESAARTWTTSLTSADLDQAAARIESYPLMYRKEIMRALTPEKRAMVWRRHLAEYLDAHPSLDDAAVTSIRAALALATAEAFSASAPKTLQAQTRILSEQIEALIGREEARSLLYRLGPADGTFASIEPLSHKVANKVRGWVVVLAGGGADCDCSQGFGCDGSGWQCGGGDGCTVDEEWPACGWFWNQTCDGTCQRTS